MVIHSRLTTLWVRSHLREALAMSDRHQKEGEAIKLAPARHQGVLGKKVEQATGSWGREVLLWMRQQLLLLLLTTKTTQAPQTKTTKTAKTKTIRVNC